MKTKTIIRNISPINNLTEMPTILFVIKKMLGFFLIYGMSVLLGEALIIGILTAMGYDPLKGVMPTGYFAELLKNYGFAVFFLIALLYCKFIEKRSIKSVGFNKRVYDYIIGGAIALLLLTAIAFVCCVTGVLSFNSIASNFDFLYLIALFIAFIIQSLAEETICRGFLLKSLSNKTSLPVAIFASSTAFALPHLPSILEADTQFAVVGVINLYLVSIIFSLLYMLRSNIYIVSGLHCVWNFVLNGVMGLSVSGGNQNSNAIMNFTVVEQNILSGGTYGLEASIITTAVLGIVTIILVNAYCKRGNEKWILTTDYIS